MNNIITVKVGENEYRGLRNEVIVQIRKCELLGYREIGALKGIDVSREIIGRVIRASGTGLNRRIQTLKIVEPKRHYSHLPKRRLNLCQTLFGENFTPGTGFESGFTWMFRVYFKGSKIQEFLINHYIQGVMYPSRDTWQTDSGKVFRNRQIKTKLLNHPDLLEEIKQRFLQDGVIRRIDG